MKSLNKSELGVLLYVKTNEKTEALSKKGYSDTLSSSDYNLPLFQDFLKYDKDPKELKEFNEEALRHFLQMRYKKTFPFSLSVFTGNKEILRKTILWWFHRNTTFDPDNVKVLSSDSLNSIQKSLIANVQTMKKAPKKTFLQIVNAGPGTGKTTAANTLAYTLREEGVLLISYTNESIKENYKRFFEFSDGKNVSGLKKYNGKDPPLINLVTVDSLAARIIGDSSDSQFDRSIQLASINIDPNKFVHPKRGRIYNHIVVDECQDIDDLRGNFILTFCRKIGIRSLTLFGDPRQRIRGQNGQWYSELWEDTFDYSKNGHNSINFDPVIRTGFEESYRFQEESVLKLVNSLSEVRLSLHVNLKSNNLKNISKCPIEIISLCQLFSPGFLERILEISGSTCIIGPSIDADNKTTNAGRRIAAAFKEAGKMISFRSDGAFVPDAIPFLTIHSVKGREFDSVFLFGMSNYPQSFPMIPSEEALSLIFVAHSRAKSKIYYIDSSEKDSFVLPLNVKSEFVNTDTYSGFVEDSHSDFDKINSAKMRHFDVRALVEDHSFLRFIEENRYSLIKDETPYEVSDWKSEAKPKEISAALWGFILGFDYVSQLTSYENVFNHYFHCILENKYIVLSLDTIVKEQLEGKIINNYKNGLRVFSKNIDTEDKILLHKIKTLINDRSFASYPEIIYLYEKYFDDMGNHTLDINILEKYRKIFLDKGPLVQSDILTKALKGGQIETSICDQDFKVLHGRIDYLDPNMNVYELKSTTSSSKDITSLLQVWLYYVLNNEPESFAYIIDLQKGILSEVKSNESLYRWRYLIRSYFIIRHHTELVTARRNYLLSYGSLDIKKRISEVDIKENTFSVDTEFYNGKDIFEIALVNMKDPYRTIVDLVLPPSLEGMIFALEWLPHTVTEMYKSNMDRVRTTFGLNTGKFNEVPLLTYYVCHVDTDWCTRTKFEKLDLAGDARKVSEKCGTFTGGNIAPKLGELYTTLAPYPLEFQKHLLAHTAVCDALMLYELVKLGILSLKV